MGPFASTPSRQPRSTMQSMEPRPYPVTNIPLRVSGRTAIGIIVGLVVRHRDRQDWLAGR